MFWKILVTIGGLAMIASFCVPWWGITVQPYMFDKKEAAAANPLAGIVAAPALSEEEQATIEAKKKDKESADEIATASNAFYTSHLSSKERGEMRAALDNANPATADAAKKSKRFSHWVFGWSMGLGIVTFAFGIAVLVLGLLSLILPLAVGVLRQWAWPAMFIAMGLSIPIFIMGLSFVFSAPSANSEKILCQGVIAGPWVAFPGAALAVLGGLIGGIVGLVCCIMHLTSKPAQQ